MEIKDYIKQVIENNMSELHKEIAKVSSDHLVDTAKQSIQFSGSPVFTLANKIIELIEGKVNSILVKLDTEFDDFTSTNVDEFWNECIEQLETRLDSLMESRKKTYIQYVATKGGIDNSTKNAIERHFNQRKGVVKHQAKSKCIEHKNKYKLKRKVEAETNSKKTSSDSLSDVIHFLDQDDLVKSLEKLLSIAKSRGDSDTVHWCELELTGYYEKMEEDDKLPKYRAIAGIYYDDIGRPLAITDPKLQFLTDYRLRNSIPELVGMSSSKDSTLGVQDASALDIINKQFGMNLVVYKFPKSALDTIFTEIRLKIRSIIDEYGGVSEHVILTKQSHSNKVPWYKRLWFKFAAVAGGLILILSLIKEVREAVGWFNSDPEIKKIDVRFCNADQGKVAFETSEEGEATLTIEDDGVEKIACSSKKFSKKHQFFFNDKLCMKKLLGAGVESGHFLSDHKYKFNIAVRDEDGKRTSHSLDQYSLNISNICMVVDNSFNDIEKFNCNKGIDLDSGKLVELAKADLRIEQRIQNNGNQQVYLVANQGIKILPNKFACDVVEINPFSLRDQKQLMISEGMAFEFKERPTTLVVKSNQGSIFKLGLRSFTPSRVNRQRTGFDMIGIRFDWARANHEGKFKK